jgi:predicted GNAT family N-acyltransferase
MRAESPNPGDAKIRISTFDLREITGTQSVEDTFRLRYEVWNEQEELFPDVRKAGIIRDDHDAHAQHWAIFVGNEMVASARMCIHKLQTDTPDEMAFRKIDLPSPVATINRLVVHKSARGLGLSRQLDTCRINAAREHAAKCIVGTAVKARIEGLQRVGFELTPFTYKQSYSPTGIFYGMILIL